MKKARGSKYKSWIIIITMGLLTIGGIGLAVRMLWDYSALMLRNTDNQLISLVRSVDKSAQSQLERYTDNLLHTVAHEERIEAEKHWLEEQDETMLRAFVKKSLLGRDTNIVDVLVIKDESVLFSLRDKIDYKIELYGSIDGIEIGLCENENGQITIAMKQDVENGRGYVVLINLELFYGGITEDLSDEMHNEIVMMDAEAKTLIYRQGNGIKVNRIKDFATSDRKYNMLSFLIEQQIQQKEGTDFCDAVSSATGKAYTARMAVVPATEDTNGLFAIGVSTDYDEITKPMHAGMVKLSFYGGTALVCISSFVLLFLQTIHRNQRALREVEILQKKNEAMEELNRKTKEFAHHQRLELMGTLTSGIAHEFNNLLAPIMGYSILILEKLPPEETELYDEVLEIYNTSMKAKTVVSRLQDLARKNAGEDYRRLVLDDIVGKVVEIAKPAKPKQVNIKMELKGEGMCILGNETQISQLLLNLLINAFHATEEKNGTVSVKTRIEEPRFLIEISDDGYGILPENIEKIFEPFFTTKKGGEGTGLGLAIAKEVVEEHNGEIYVESQENIGTSFLIILPIFS